MDGQRFDDVVRALAGGASRRGVLKRLAGGGAAAAGLALGGRAAGAAKGDCGPCKVRGAGGRCEYACNRTCEVCDPNAKPGGVCVRRQPFDPLVCACPPDTSEADGERCAPIATA